MTEKTALESVFDDYHEKIRSELSKDTSIIDKIEKTEPLVFLLDGLVSGYSSEKFLRESLEIKERLQKMSINLQFKPTLQKEYYKNLISWLGLILRQEKRFNLWNNLRRVDFSK